MAKSKQNSYLLLANGLVIGDHADMEKLYKPKVALVRQILSLSAHVLSEAFDGMKGRHQLEGVRHSMILELDGSDQRFCSWRELAELVKSRHSSDYC